jgi:PadR family transcriptional regulator PadR
MGEFKKQINKGVLELAVLKLLNENDQYGYAIMQQVSDRSDTQLHMKDGTLYPILYRLEDNKLIKSYWQQPEGRGKPRKYYQITKAGKVELENMISEYLSVSLGINKLLNLGGKK